MGRLGFITLLAFVLLLGTGCSQPHRLSGKEKPSSPPAASVTQKKEQNDSFDVDETYREAKDYERAYELEKAKELFEKIVDKAPKDHKRISGARLHLGKIYYWLGEYEPAIREFKIILKENPPEPAPSVAKSNLALCYLASDRPLEALKYINQDIDDYSRWETHYSFLALAHYAAWDIDGDPNHLDNLKQSLKEGIEKSQTPLQNYMLNASLQIFNKDYRKAAEYMEKAIDETSEQKDEISLIFLVGAINAKTGNTKASLKFFNEVLERVKDARTLDRITFMDAFYSYWAITQSKDETMDLKKIREFIDLVPGRFAEPESAKFVENIELLIEEEKSGNYREAIAKLKKMKDGVEDESIEGDFFYDALYKPYILYLLHRETALNWEKAGEKVKSADSKAAAVKALEEDFLSVKD